jgi:acyl carrier protein
LILQATNQAKLRDIFRFVFELDGNANVADIRQINQPNWDSLAHVSLVAAIESEFGINIDTVDTLRITSYRAAELFLEEKGF